MILKFIMAPHSNITPRSEKLKGVYHVRVNTYIYRARGEERRGRERDRERGKEQRDELYERY